MKRSARQLPIACQLVLLLLPVVTIMARPDDSFAWGGIDTPMGSALCTVTDWFTGNVGKGLAVIIVITLGVKSIPGKVSWGRILLVGGGIALIFGAFAIVNLMLEYNSIVDVPFCDQEDKIEEFDRRLQRMR